MHQSVEEATRRQGQLAESSRTTMHAHTHTNCQVHLVVGVSLSLAKVFGGGGSLMVEVVPELPGAAPLGGIAMSVAWTEEMNLLHWQELECFLF